MRGSSLCEFGRLVRSGGHSGAGHSTADGGIVLDVRDLNSLEIDVPNRTAWAGAGLTAGAYTTAAAAHGLATGYGDTGSVGLGGLTLGGGVGLLSRKYGLTIDSLLAAEVVTADGAVLRVDDRSHPELFWAIRGGGGNFGVATRFQFRLQPVDDVATVILARLAASDAAVRVTQLRVLGGAIARVPSASTAYAHRTSHTWSTWPRSPTARTTERRARGGWRSSPRPCTRATTASTSTFLRTTARLLSAPPTRVRPGTG